MQTSTTEPRPPLDRLLPLADLVRALTCVSGRAVACGDAALATELLRTDGDCARCGSALHEAWLDLLRSANASRSDQASAVALLVSLDNIADLATSICERVAGVANRETALDVPALRRLAELVPEQLNDALGAVRANDGPSAQRVLDRSVSVDACFAQVHLELLQLAGEGSQGMDAAQQLHALGRALERIGDDASEIAATVRRSPSHLEP